MTSATDCPFDINGRFLTQSVTGVQRYAREITAEIDRMLAERGGRGRIIVPTQPVDAPRYQALEIVTASPLTGHPWEQFTLPRKATRPLLNLCNTAPVVAARQIVCIHDASLYLMPDSFSRAFRVTYKAMQPILSRRARLTSVSHFAAKQLGQFLPAAAGKIAVMPDGHEHALRWNADASDILQRFPIKRRFIVLLGSRARHKNAQMILNLAGELDQLGLDLVVAGGGASVFAHTEQVDAPNVIRVGFVSDDDLAALFAQALCLVFPSITEGFGLPIVEAMARGCPVISSDASCMPEICGDAALLASPYQPRQWLEHIRALADSDAIASTLVARGHNQVLNFSWRKSAAAYLALSS